MGVRIGHLAAAACVLACAACSNGIGSLTAPTTSTPSAITPSVEVSTDHAAQPPYIAATDQVRALARRFVTAALGYDTSSEDARTFLTRLDDLATSGEIDRLRHSGRAHLRWWVLRQRLERATVQITGVSEVPGPVGPRTLRVEAVRTTTSDVSTVRDFIELTLVVVRTPQGWRVDRAEGGGL